MPLNENQFGRLEISSSALRKGQVPAVGKGYSLAIVEFALSFDGYEHYDPAKVSKINELAYAAFLNDGSLPRTLNRLRACLFAQQRSWRDSEGPDVSSLRFIHALVQRIRRIVERREKGQASRLAGGER